MKNPLRVLEAFAVAQEHEVPLTRKALRLIRENLHHVNDEYRTDPECIAIFMRILNSERRVMRSLMAMNEVGLLARFLPEWEQIVYRWQHVMYHTYTVDVHSIFLVEELRRLWRGRYEKEQPELTELMRAVDDRPVLFLGCLLHDIGKGLGGDHSMLGAERARRCVERLGLDAERVERVVFLVQFHLQMARLAQSRDLSDPKLIFEFARLVGDRNRLRDLYLLTFSDIRASSKKAWTDWKGQLLGELFERTSELIESGSDDPSRALELTEKRVEQRRLTAAEELLALGITDSEIEQFFGMMPHRYFIAHKPRQIARHAQVVLAVDQQSGFRLRCGRCAEIFPNSFCARLTDTGFTRTWRGHWPHTTSTSWDPTCTRVDQALRWRCIGLQLRAGARLRGSKRGRISTSHWRHC